MDAMQLILFNRRVSIFLFLLIFALALIKTPLYSQTTLTNLGLSSRYQTYGQGIGLEFELKSKKPLQKLSLSPAIGFFMMQNDQPTFKLSTSTRSYAMEIRYYPFSKELVSGCDWQSSKLGKELLKGFFLAPGIQINMNKITVTPNATLESPIKTLDAWLNEWGLTTFVGYQTNLKSLNFGVGYGLSISHITSKDQHSILNEAELLTASSPFSYRLLFTPRFSIGIHL
jgi:hypothetical protein